MKIAFVAAANSIHTVRWVNALASRNHEIHLIYNKDHAESKDKISEKVRCYQLRFGGALAYYLNAKQLEQLIMEISPDVINVHYASGYGTLARMAHLNHILLSVWGSDVYDFPNRNRLNEWIFKKNIDFAEKIASTSKCMALELERVMGRKMPIEITPFGVDLKQYNGEHDKVRIPFVIGTIKTLEFNYRIDVFIRAISILEKKLRENDTEKNLEIIVEIYGDGSQRKTLQMLIKELDLEEIVFLKGAIPNKEVPKVLRHFGIFCASSKKESFGVSVIEAMAMRCPVVATDTEGFKEVMENQKQGIIVPTDDEKAIADALMKLLDDEELRKQFGEAGRKQVIENYDWEKNVDKMETIYESMRGGR